MEETGDIKRLQFVGAKCSGDELVTNSHCEGMDRTQAAPKLTDSAMNAMILTRVDVDCFVNKDADREEERLYNGARYCANVVSTICLGQDVGGKGS